MADARSDLYQQVATVDHRHGRSCDPHAIADVVVGLLADSRRRRLSNGTGRDDASTTGQHHTRDQTSRRHLELRRRRGGGGACRGVVARPPSRSLGGCRFRAVSTTSWWTRRSMTTSGTSGTSVQVFIPRGLGRTACRPPFRRGDPPRRGVGRRHLGHRARGWLHAFRGRRDRHRPAGRGAPADRRRQQRAHLAVHPTGRRGECCRTGPVDSGNTTTSSTMPACTAASGCIRRRTARIDDITVVTEIDDGDRRRPLCRRGRRWHRDITASGYGSGMPMAPWSPPAKGAEGELRVAAPELWGPGHGYLYDLEVELAGDGGRRRPLHPAGRASAPCGSKARSSSSTASPSTSGASASTRTSTCTAAGTTMPPWCTTSPSSRGSAPTRFAPPTIPTRRRCWTTPTDMGIVVIDETAAVGLNLGVGGGLFLGGPRTTYSEETISPATQLVHRQAIEELIARDKNHPCVVLWSLANEPESHTEAGRAYFEPLFAAARSGGPEPARGLRQHDVRAPRHLHGDRPG